MKALDLVDRKAFDEQIWQSGPALRALHALHSAYRLPTTMQVQTIREHLVTMLKSQAGLLIAEPFLGGGLLERELALLAGVETLFRRSPQLPQSKLDKIMQSVLGRGRFEHRFAMREDRLGYERAFRLAVWNVFNAENLTGIAKASFGVAVDRGQIPDFVLLTKAGDLVGFEFKLDHHDLQRFPAQARAFHRACDEVYLVTASRTLFAAARRHNRGRNAPLHGPAYAFKPLQEDLRSLQCGLMVVATDGTGRVFHRQDPQRPLLGSLRPERAARQALLDALEVAPPYAPTEDAKYVAEVCARPCRAFSLARMPKS